MELTEFFSIYKNCSDEDLLEVFSKEIAILIKGYNKGEIDASSFLKNNVEDLTTILQDFNIISEYDSDVIDDLLIELIRERVEYNIKMDPGAYSEYLNVEEIVDRELESASLDDYYSYATVMFDRTQHFVITL